MKKCKRCGKEFTRKTENSFESFERQKFCSRGCATGHRSLIHGYTTDRTKMRFYSIYCDTKKRCENQKSTGYYKYGARGIKVLWPSFIEFAKDMLPSYLKHVQEHGEENTTLERADNNGHYCKENCRWATHVEQTYNKRNTIRVSHNGRTLTFFEWSKLIGTPAHTLYQSWYKKLPLERVFR